MVEALINTFLDTDGEGQFTQQQITAIGVHLLEGTATCKAVEHPRMDAVAKQQIEGFVGKKLWRQGQRPRGKPQVVLYSSCSRVEYDENVIVIQRLIRSHFD